VYISQHTESVDRQGKSTRAHTRTHTHAHRQTHHMHPQGMDQETPRLAAGKGTGADMSASTPEVAATPMFPPMLTPAPQLPDAQVR
jgi:hypothetical protein